MRRFIFGLLAALMAAAVLPATAMAADAPAKPFKIDPASITKGMTEAPAVIAQVGLSCELDNARFIGTSREAKTKLTSKYYEIACKNAEGYIVSVPEKAGAGAPVAFTCLFVGVDKGPATCNLPQNADPKAGIAALVAQDEPTCQMTNARGVGHNPTVTVLEVACQGGAGYIIEASYPISLSKPATFAPCAGIQAGSAMECKLTDAAATTTYIDGLAAKMGKPCAVKDRRYVGADPKGAAYFEVACTDGKGYMMEVAKAGAVTPIDCAVADNIGGGCTLTNSREAQTEQDGLYSKFAHAAGFACDVSKYGPIPANVPGHEVVELQCSNRPDGGIGIFSDSDTQPGQVDNCAVSELAGYRCSFTKPEAAFPLLTADLKKLGKNSCVVSGERIVGTTAEKLGYIEVACADGNPGYLVSYNLGNMSVKEAIACSFAKDVAGGCQMPQNQKHG